MGGTCMNFTDEKDYIMRMIKEMVSVLFSLALGKKYTSVELENENKFQVSGRPLKDFKAMIDCGQINEAENILLDEMDYANEEDVITATLFYQYLCEKEESFLQKHQYSKEEVLFGAKDLLEKSGYHDLLEILQEKI